MLELKPKKFNARRAWEEGETEMIRISEAAAKKLKETIAKQKNSQNTMLFGAIFLLVPASNKNNR